MSLNGTEWLIFDTFSKFKQWKETLKTDRGLQFTFQWSRVQNGSQHWRYTCKHVRLTNTHPHKFAYMMVAIEVDGKVQVELNAPNINQDLFEENSLLKDAEASELEQSGEAEPDHDETAQAEKSDTSSEEQVESENAEQNEGEAAQSGEPGADYEENGESEESYAAKAVALQAGEPENTHEGTAQTKEDETNQNGMIELEQSETSHEKMDAGNTTEEETESSSLRGAEAETDAQDDTESARSSETLNLEESKTNSVRNKNQKKGVVKHSRPWENIPTDSFETRFDGSIEIAVEADPDLFLRKNEKQPQENNSRKKFKNSEGTSNEIIHFSTRNIDLVSESDGSEQVAQRRSPNLFIRIALKFFSVSKRTQSVSPSR